MNKYNALKQAMNDFVRLNFWYFFLVLSTVFSIASQAQTDQTGDPGGMMALEEVLVTARRRTESMMDVPVAVSVLNSNDVSRYHANDLRKIGELVPQVNLAEAGSGSGASFTIRGIGSAWVNPGIEQAVAISLDGVQVGRGRIVKMGMFDLEQVEVLKGPQALFFGKNSPAGVVSLTSKNPGDEAEGYIRGGYEFEARERYVEGAVSYPFSEDFQARVALRGVENEGFVDNHAVPRPAPYDPSIILPGAENDTQPTLEEMIGRLTVVYDAGNNLNATFKISYSNVKRDSASNSAQAVCANGIDTPTVFGLPDPTGDCELDKNRSVTSMPHLFAETWPEANGGKTFMDQDSILSSLEVNFRLDNMTITSVTGLADLDYESFEEYTYTSLSSIWGSDSEQYQQLSQEIRLVTDLDTALNYTVGGYFEDTSTEVLTSAMLGYVGPDPVTGNYHAYTRFGETSNKTYSLYGQLKWNISDALELAAGARWTREDKKLDQMGHSFNHSMFAGAFVPVGEIFNGSFDDDDVSPEVTLTWRLDESAMFYAAYKTGYKSGGFSLPGNLNALETLDSLTFSSETAEGFEAGYKARFFGKSMRFDATIYHYEFNDLQVSSFDADTTRFIVRNAAEAISEGLEANILWRASDNLIVRGAFGYNNAEYENFPGASCYAGQSAQEGCIGGVQDLSGVATPRAPDWVFNVGMSYDLHLDNGLLLTFTGDANYTEGHNVQENNNPVSYQDSFWRVNSGLRLHGLRSNWELSLVGRNLTDEYYMVTATDKPVGGPGQVAAGLQRPREIAIQATWRF